MNNETLLLNVWKVAMLFIVALLISACEKSSSHPNRVASEIKMSIDVDGDGTSDGVLVDEDNDGRYDGMDSNSDGTVDVDLSALLDARIDFNGNGVFSDTDDGILVDIDDDGIVDGVDTNGNGSVDIALDKIDEAVSGTLASYTIQVNVTGLNGGTLVIQNNQGDNLQITENGIPGFTNSLYDGASYAVTILDQPLGQVCSVTDASGSLAGGNLTLSISCLVAKTVTAAIDGIGGALSFTSRTVGSGSTTSLLITPDSGYYISNVAGCSGTLTGNNYTTGIVNADCAISVQFTRKTYSISTVLNGTVSLSPSSSVVQHGGTASFTIAENKGWNIDGVSGCGGTLNGQTYTTAAITANCDITISSSFTTTPRFSMGSQSYSRSCYTFTNGIVKCWGRNRDHLLGLPLPQSIGDDPNEMGVNLPAVNLGTSVVITDIQSKGYHTCALRNDGGVICWGRNSNGELGIGKRATKGDEILDMGDALQTVNLGANVAAQAITVGISHSCALTTTGEVKCWGGNSHGELGNGSTFSIGTFPSDVANGLQSVDLGLDGSSQPLRATAISAGNFHTCALLESGDVKCWGWNVSGQLGQDSNTTLGDNAGEMGNNLNPVALGGGLRAIQIAAGSAHSCALLTDDAATPTISMKCWGSNAYGELGQDSALVSIGEDAVNSVTTLSAINLGGQPSKIYANGMSTCALLVGGSVKCWGENTNGQLGQGSTAHIGGQTGDMAALNAIDLGTNEIATDLAMGGVSVCALLQNNGTSSGVKCWGAGYYGQLGSGSIESVGRTSGQMGDNLAFVAIGAGVTTSRIAGGNYHFCALQSDSSVYCWGHNADGQLGLGGGYNPGDEPNEMANLPAVDLGVDRRVVRMASSGEHHCAILGGGAVKCWGNTNSNGELGYANLDSATRDPSVMGDELPEVDLGTDQSAVPYRATAIATGFRFTCAVLHTGEVKCWGETNTYGQLGLGLMPNKYVGLEQDTMGNNLPVVQLGDGVQAVDLVAGHSHACALLSSGNVKCWGRNNSGQLGYDHSSTIGTGAGQMGNSLPNVNLGDGRTAKSIVAGSEHTCALLDNDQVKCWGDNSSGALGMDSSGGSVGTVAGDMANLASINLGTGRTAKAITAGTSHSCAILDTGAVKCWGENGDGQLGYVDLVEYGINTNEMGDLHPLVDLGTGRTAVDITAGSQHTCARLDDDSMKCWGLNDDGQLGLGDESNRGFYNAEVVKGDYQMGDLLPALNVNSSN